MNCAWAEFPGSSLVPLSLVTEAIRKLVVVVNCQCSKAHGEEMNVTPVFISADPL